MRKKIQSALVYLVTALLLWYLLKGMKWGEIYSVLRTARWTWLFLSFLAVAATFFTRVQRWSYIVRSAKPVSYKSLFSATQIGFLGNFTLPGRLGEVIRAVVLCRLTDLPFAKAIAFVALDRVTDLLMFMLVVLISVSVFHPENDIQLPPDIWKYPISKDILSQGATATLLFVTALIAGLVLLYVNQRIALRIAGACTRPAAVLLAVCLRWFARLAPGAALGKRAESAADAAANLEARVLEMLQHFADGLHVFRSISDMVKTVVFSLITWGLALLSYHCVLEAFDLGVTMPWYAAFFMLAMLSFFISAPGPPGFLGTFEAGIAAALVFVAPTVSIEAALAVAVVSHLINVIAVAIVGAWCLHSERMGLLELRRESTTGEISKEDSEHGGGE